MIEGWPRHDTEMQFEKKTTSIRTAPYYRGTSLFNDDARLFRFWSGGAELSPTAFASSPLLEPWLGTRYFTKTRYAHGSKAS